MTVYSKVKNESHFSYFVSKGKTSKILVLLVGETPILHAFQSLTFTFIAAKTDDRLVSGMAPACGIVLVLEPLPEQFEKIMLTRTLVINNFNIYA